jgi:hypothetical protein
MVDSIKITALQDIGANIAYTTLVPLVNMAGTPTTQKSNLQNLGNLILNGAGGSYFARAAQANLALSVANAAQPNITSVGTLTTLAVTGNITAGNINGGNIVVANFYYGDGGFLTNVASGSNYSNSNVANYLPTYTGNVGAGNVNVTGTVYANGISSTGLASLTTVNVAANLGVANIRSAGNLGVTANTLTWNFTNQGVLQWPGGIGQIDTNNSTFEIHSTNGLMISTNEANSSQSFLFDNAGVFTAPGNVNLLGSRLNVGPTAANVANLLNPTLVIANSGASYIQAAIINSNANGSSDWSADGAGGSDDAAWTDMGFTGYNFNDANYTVTAPGDGYLFVQGYANGIGGNMVLATGDNSNTADIIFATGGFLANAEFARIDHANDVFHLTRANSGIKFDDGSVQTTAYIGGAGSELVNGNNSFVLDVDGNVVFEGNVAGQAVDRGLVWDYGANANGVNSMVRQDNNGLTVRAWTELGGGANGYSAPVNIVTNQDANEKQWVFDGSGNLTLPGNLRVPDGIIVSGSIAPTFDVAITGITTGNATVIVTIADELFEGPFQGQVTISGVTGTTEANGTWYYEAVEIADFQLYTDDTYTTPVDGTTWTTYISGGTAVSVGTYTALTIQGGNVSIGSNSETWSFNSDGSTIYPTLTVTRGDRTGTLTGQTLLFGDSTQEAIITTPNGTNDINASQRFVINPGAGAANTTGEGGDIYLYAGRGGNLGGSGGDIKIRGGLAPVDGAGGYLDIQGGDTQGNGTGGYIDIRGGESGNAVGGAVNLYGGYGPTVGGNVTITGGQSGTGDGGNVTITGGVGGNGLPTYGNVNIAAGASTWTFGNDGNLILANGNSIVRSVANSSLDPINPNVSTMVLIPDSVYSSQSLVLDPTAPGHIHLRAPSANIDEPLANIFLGGETSSFEVGYYNGSAPNVFIHSGGNTWKFLNDGILVFPRDTGPNTTDPILNIIGGANPTITSTDASVAGPANLGISALNTIFTGSSGDAIKIYPDDGEIGSTGNLQIWANSGGNTEYSWTFGNDGVLTLPQGSQISETANTSVNITANTNTWAFGVDGNLTLPGDLVAISASPAPVIRGFSSVSALQFTNGNSNVTINANSNTWTFDSTGNLIIPGSSGGFIKTVANASIGVAAVDNGTNNPAQLLSMTNAGAATSIVSAYATNATIQTNATGTINTWAFDNAGNLTLPGNTFAVNYANGTQVPVGVTQDITSNGAMSIMLYDGNIKYNNYATVEPSTGNITGGNLITSGQITSTKAGNLSDGGGQLYLNGSGNNRIDFNTNGTGAPSFTTRSAGTKVVLYPSIGASATDYAVGVDSGTFWSGIPAADAGQFFRWYGGTTEVANLSGTGILTVTGNISGANISTTGNISGNTNGFAIGYLNIPQVAAANATLALTDAGKHYYSTTAGNFTLTVPNNTSAAFATGTAISIVVQAAGNILVNAASGVTLYMAGNSTAANRVVGGYGMATLMKVATDTWMINGTGVS